MEDSVLFAAYFLRKKRVSEKEPRLCVGVCSSPRPPRPPPSCQSRKERKLITICGCRPAPKKLSRVHSRKCHFYAGGEVEVEWKPDFQDGRGGMSGLPSYSPRPPLPPAALVQWVQWDTGGNPARLKGDLVENKRFLSGHHRFHTLFCLAEASMDARGVVKRKDEEWWRREGGEEVYWGFYILQLEEVQSSE